MLAVGAVGAGLVQIPNVDYVIDNFLRPSFATSPLYEPHTKDGLLWFGLALGTVLGLAGIAIAYRIWVARPGNAERHPRARRRALHAVREQVVLRRGDRRGDRAPVRRGRRTSPATPSSAVSSTRRSSAARTGLVRAGSAAVRAAQSGFMRYYAALLVLGVAGVGLYFLLQS